MAGLTGEEHEAKTLAEIERVKNLTDKSHIKRILTAAVEYLEQNPKEGGAVLKERIWHEASNWAEGNEALIFYQTVMTDFIYDTANIHGREATIKIAREAIRKCE
jgi:hypothetical protein